MKKHKLAPWWLYLIVGLLISPLVLILAIVVRLIVGIPNGTPREDAIQFLAWVCYTVSWAIFVIAGHKKQGFYTFFPYSALVYGIAMVLLFLIT